MLFEIEGVTDELAQSAFRLAGQKLSVKTSIVDKKSLFSLAA